MTAPGLSPHVTDAGLNPLVTDGGLRARWHRSDTLPELAVDAGRRARAAAALCADPVQRAAALAPAPGFHQVYVEAIDALRSTRGTIVDLGCGLGGALSWMAASGRAVLGIDPSHDALHLARLLFPGLTVLRGSVTATPLPPACTDAVTAFGLLSCVRDPSVVVREAARLLRPGGLLIVGDLLRTGVVLPLAPPPFNHFVNVDVMVASIGRSGFDTVSGGLTDTAAAPDWWHEAVARVEGALTTHPVRPADETSQRMQRLLAYGALQPGLVVASRSVGPDW